MRTFFSNAEIKNEASLSDQSEESNSDVDVNFELPESALGGVVEERMTKTCPIGMN